MRSAEVEQAMQQKQWRFKACPKCRGDVFLDYAWGDQVFKCLQCGHTLNRAEEARLGLVTPREREAEETLTLARRKAA